MIPKSIRESRALRAVTATLLVLLQTVAMAARPGAYTDYGFAPDAPPTFDAYEMYITWEEAPLRGAIYPAFTFGFEAGGGYMGTQLGNATHSVLFSIWDAAGDDSGTAVPGPGCSRFGGEGTGAHCGFEYPWVSGREYRLRVALAGSDADGDDWRASIQDTVSGIETTIGTLHLRNVAPYHGYGRLKSGASTFLEYFGGPDGCEHQPYARVRWRGPFGMPGSWAPTSAFASYAHPCPTHNDQWSPGPPVVVVAGGGTGTPITNRIPTRLWPACSYGFSLSDSRVSVANAACWDPSLAAPASSAGDVADYHTLNYPNGSGVAGTVSAVANGTDAWVAFFKQPGFAGEAFCLGPHRSAELFKYAGWNDVVTSHRSLGVTGPCSPAPAECAVAVATSACGDGVLDASCGEECDVGPSSAGCCDESCQLRPAGTSCEDGDQCTTNDSCDTAGACTATTGCGDGVVDDACGEVCDPGLSSQCCDADCHGAPAGTWCNDVDVCTDSDVCDGFGACHGAVDPSPVCGTGLSAEYYDDLDLMPPAAVVRTDARIDFDWDWGSPDPAINGDTFSARWTGFVLPRYSEPYTFITTTDDGVRLWIDDQLLVDSWVAQPSTRAQGTIPLQAGRKYPVRMEYFERYVFAVAKLSWSSPSQAEQLVPQSVLFPTCGDGGLHPDGRCDAGCPGGVPLEEPWLRLTKLTAVPGRQTLALKGRFALSAPLVPGLDPIQRGMRVRVGGTSGVVVDAIVPPGAQTRESGGWRRSGTGFKYTGVAATAPGGITKISVRERGGAVTISVRGRGTYPAVAAGLPLDVTVGLDADPSSTQCGVTAFVAGGCTPDSRGTRVLCR